MKNYDYIILGGGISGLSFGKLLDDNTKKSFLILEKENEIGGLCRTRVIDGNTIDIGGGHFLHTKHQEVYDFVFSLVPEEKWMKYMRNTKINIHDTFIDFPIENNIWQLPKEQQFIYISSMIDSIENTQKTELTFKDWIINNLGKEVAENYLIPYNTKIWGIDVNEMSTDWLYKIPKLNIKEVIWSIIFGESNKDKYPSHDYFYYPKEGGFQVIVDKLYEQLKNNVTLNEEIKSLKYDSYKKIWTVNNKYKTKILINTVPWTSLQHSLNHNKIKNLKHNSIVVSLRKKEYKNNWQWCYIPDIKIPYHREFYINNYCLNNKDNAVALETNIKRWNNDEDNIYYHINEYAYPIPTIKHRESIDKILEFYLKINMFGLGRWGQWEYHNSDVCIYESMNLFKKLEGIKNEQ